MIHAVLTACLAANLQACQPIVLTEATFATVGACEAEAPRIAQGWLRGHADLVRQELRCVPTGDLPALPLEPVAEGVFVNLGQTVQYDDSPDGWIANLGVVVGRDSIAVIDAGTSREQGQALYGAIRLLSDKPISHLILTHVHPDHVLGAEVFRVAGATVVGHARLADDLRARGPIYLDNLARLYPPARMLGTAVTLPDTAVADRMEIDLGGRRLTLTAVGPAHTDSDLIVQDSATGTLFTGDLVFRDLTPIVDGSLTGWLDWMQVPPQGAPVVPGHGPVAPDWETAVAAQRAFLTALERATRDRLGAGLPMSEAVPAIVEDLGPLSGQWNSFPDSAARDATAAYKELEWE